jgi:hypothetical protein
LIYRKDAKYAKKQRGSASQKGEERSKIVPISANRYSQTSRTLRPLR